MSSRLEVANKMYRIGLDPTVTNLTHFLCCVRLVRRRDCNRNESEKSGTGSRSRTYFRRLVVPFCATRLRITAIRFHPPKGKIRSTSLAL